jgi:hypothetical protein
MKAAAMPYPWTFRERAAPLRAAWRAADLDQQVAGPGGEAPLRFRADHQITELAVHDWDLARATGQQDRLAGWFGRDPGWMPDGS